VARRTDRLHDLTANVLLGRRLPAGTGWGQTPSARPWRLAAATAGPGADPGDNRLILPALDRPLADEAEIDEASLAALLAAVRAVEVPAAPV